MEPYFNIPPAHANASRLSETNSDFAFFAPTLCKRLPPKFHRRRRRRCSGAFFNRAFSFGPVMFLAKPGHAECIPDTVECRASERLLLSKGSREQERDNAEGRGGGLASANAESPPKPSKLNRALTFSTKRKAVLLAHCERGVKANKKQSLSSKLSGPAPENINTASVLTAQSEPFPNKKKSRENCNRSFIHRERHFFFPEQCR